MKKTIWIYVAILALTMASTIAPLYAQKGADSKSTQLRVDINTATVEELTQLPGIGEKVAARIVDYRKENGRFQKIQEIMNVRGIGEKTFVKLEKYLVVQAEGKGDLSQKKRS